MTSLFAPAVKEKLKARVAIDGPTGSGKTWTALQWARILVGPDGPIGVIDTENRSAAYYAPTPGQLAGAEPVERLNHWDPPYVFGHMPWLPPFDPIRLTQVIQAAGQELGEDGCLVIDSFSHFWEGEGGTLDLVDNAASRSYGGNRFAGWKEGTPAQRALLDAIIHAPCHVICCMRSKMDWVLEEDDSGGRRTTKPKKVGLKPIQRDGVEYEFTVVADMDLEHRLTVTKSRCSLIADAVATKGRSAEPAQLFASWLDSGVERITVDQVKQIVEVVKLVPDEHDRAALRQAFATKWGRSTDVTTDQYAEVMGWTKDAAARMGAILDQPEAPTEKPTLDQLREQVAAIESNDGAGSTFGTTPEYEYGDEDPLFPEDEVVDGVTHG